MTQISGLTSSQVKKQAQAGKINKSVNDEAKTNWQIIKENTFTYFNLIFIVLAVLLIIVGEYKDLTFLPVIIANTAIGIFQEIRAKKVLDKLNVINTTKITVVRDNKKQVIPIEKLVLGDIISLKTGEQIPADAQMISGQLKVNESLLTGEADEITKNEKDDLLSGSFVVAGQGYAKLTKVGKDSYISRLTLKAKKMNSLEQSEMIKAINRFIKWVGVAIIPIGVALFSIAFYRNHIPLPASVSAMEAAIIGMIPEGLYLLTTVALAISAMNLAKNQVMLHDMKSVETLARVNVLCVDKTGTITEPVMQVLDVIPINQSKKHVQHAISNLAQSMPQDNETSKALSKYFTNSSVISKKIIPFTSVKKYSGAVFDDQTYIIGAPEFVLRDQFKEYKNLIDNYTKQGYRVLAFATTNQILDAEHNDLKDNVDLQALILIANPVRKEAKKTFSYFEKQGVAIKVISGDNPLTVARVAKQAGIKDTNYVDARELNDSNYDEAVQKYSVFGRVKPEQKRKLINAFQRAGNTVAMTGDGVNDILAMKKADCSVAMGSGNSAAIQAAQVVLLNSDFARMPKIVDEGRRVVNNIERSASLFLVKNIFSILMAVIAILFTITYPLRPTQLALISGFTIGVPSFLLALENNFSPIKGKFMTTVLQKAIPGGVTDMVAVGLLVLVNKFLQLPHKEMATVATLLLIAVGLLVLHHISAPMNKYRGIVFIGTCVAIVLAIMFGHNLFALYKISPAGIILFVILFALEICIFNLLNKVVRIKRKNNR